MLAGLAAAGLACAAPAGSRTWNIYADGSGDARTIQRAMELAAFGDTVLVWPGTYLEAITMTSGVTLVSQAGPASTILNGRPHPYVIDAGRTNPVTQVVVEGFTLTGTTNSFAGPARTIDVDGDAQIRGCVVTGVRALVAGAHLRRGDLRIHDTVFAHNQGGFLDPWVSGVSVQDGYLVVERCTFLDCTRGFVLRVDGGVVEFLENVVRESERIEIVATKSVVIYDNVFDGVPFPITVWGGPPVIVRQNTFARAGPNVAALGPSLGANTIVDRNVMTGARQGLVLCCPGITVTCNDSWGNEINWSGRGDLTGIDGNFSAPPEYCDPANGDFSVSSDSPLLSQNSPCDEQVGALVAGCPATPVEGSTWGSIKARYKSPDGSPAAGSMPRSRQD
jgi:hypothetical protein